MAGEGKKAKKKNPKTGVADPRRGLKPFP